jgi:hypothetical protein
MPSVSSPQGDTSCTPIRECGAPQGDTSATPTRECGATHHALLHLKSAGRNFL